MKLKLIFLIAILTNWLWGTTLYEDGNSASDWTISDNRPSGAIVSSVSDNGENVIEFNGHGRKNAYLLGDKRASSKSWNNSDDKNITWSMKFNESFRISVYVKTTKGSRVLYYDNKSNKGKRRTKIHYGLGSQSSNGEWQTVSRDLEADLQEFESNNELEMVYGFEVRGSGRVDDIKTLNELQTPTLAMVTGRISTINGIVIPDVNVKVFQDGNPIATTDTTDDNGLFDLNLAPDENFTLQFEADGYSTQVKTIETLVAGQQINLDIIMVARGVEQSFQGATGSTLSGQDGASVEVGANAFVDGNGNPVAGEIRATITPVDVSGASGLEAFPGNFTGIEEGATEPTPIASYGVVEYRFTDSSGNELQLAQGETAVIVLPIFITTHPDGSAIEIGDNIPLWYLNENTGLWEQDGVGEVIASSTSPTGLAMRATVSHFSWWNIDAPLNSSANVNLTVHGPDTGSATVNISTANFNWSSYKSASVGQTVNIIRIPANTNVCFSANVIFDHIGQATTNSVCTTLTTGSTTPIDLNVSSGIPLAITANPLVTNTEVGEAPAQIEIFPTTVETSVTYTTTPATCSLPTGVALMPKQGSLVSAVIIGTPLNEGNFTCTVIGEDSDGNTATVDIEYNVAVSPITPIWSKTLNDGMFEDVVVDINGYSYAVGHKYADPEFCEENVYVDSIATVVKFDHEGNIVAEWNRDCNTSSRFHAVTLDDFGNVYAVGYKYDTIGGGEISSYAAGGGEPTEESPSETLLVKLTSDLAFIYEKNLGVENNNTLFNGVVIYNNGTFQDSADDRLYAVGQTVDWLGYYDPKDMHLKYNIWWSKSKSLVAGYKLDGTLLFDTTTSNYAENTILFDVDIDSAGGVWASGQTLGGNEMDGYRDDALLVAIDTTNGAETPWSREIYLNSTFYGIDISPDNNIYLAGETLENVYTGVEYYDLTNTFIAKYKIATGTRMWDKTFSGTQMDKFYDIKYSPLNDSVYAVGYSYSSDGDITNGNNGSSDALLMRFNPIDGSKVWDKTIGAYYSDEFRGLALDNAGSIYGVGQYEGFNWINKMSE